MLNGGTALQIKKVQEKSSGKELTLKKQM